MRRSGSMAFDAPATLRCCSPRASTPSLSKPLRVSRASLSVTTDLYSHLTPAMGNQTAAAMEDALQEDIEVAGEGSEIGAA